MECTQTRILKINLEIKISTSRDLAYFALALSIMFVITVSYLHVLMQQLLAHMPKHPVQYYCTTIPIYCFIVSGSIYRNVDPICMPQNTVYLKYLKYLRANSGYKSVAIMYN